MSQINHMSKPTHLPALDLAALLSSRVCHDIVSPVGAIVNGIELMGEDGDMKDFAMELIQSSARQASAKVQFARIAFGAAGSAGAEIDIADAENVAKGLFEFEKAEIEWSAPVMLLAKNKVKLLLNMVLISLQFVPRGGVISVTVEDNGNLLRIKAKGPSQRIPADLVKIMTGGNAPEDLDAHMVQPVYASLLADNVGLTLTIKEIGDEIELCAG